MKRDIYYSKVGIITGKSLVTGKENTWMRSVIFEMNGKEYEIENANFGLRRKYPDFMESKKAHGLHPLQIIYAGVDIEKTGTAKYRDKYGEIHKFSDMEV